MSDEVDLLKRVYDRFNARDMETVLAALHEDVIWANGMEGGHVHGRDEVRSYWTRQWTMVDPHVEPVAFARDPFVQYINQRPATLELWPFFSRKGPTAALALLVVGDAIPARNHAGRRRLFRRDLGTPSGALLLSRGISRRFF
jgi:hypothetical protein